jgi:hypothetical protein
MAALLAIPGYEVDTVNFERRFNLTHATAQALLDLVISAMSSHQIKVSLTSSISTAEFLAVQKELVERRIIDEQRFMLRDQVAALAARDAALAKEVGGTGFTVAQYRDASLYRRN